jgi:hypothetical protein
MNDHDLAVVETGTGTAGQNTAGNTSSDQYLVPKDQCLNSLVRAGTRVGGTYVLPC